MINDFELFLQKGARAHLVGIGGVSMSPLAEILNGFGLRVTGSDIFDGPSVQHLRTLGIDIKTGHHPGNIEGADFLIRTAAARDDNPEIAAARNTGIPVFERAQAWGCIMRRYKNAICIAGTHGKTTTTSMTTHILMAAGVEPTVMIGGTLPLLKSGYRVGSGDTIVLESCEYYNSFHSFFPTIAVILNIDADHLDFFSDLDEIKNSFRDFAALTPKNGVVIANGDDTNTMDALHGLDRDVFTFGTSENVRLRAENMYMHEHKVDFDITLDGTSYLSVSLQVPGLHNMYDALAATSCALCLGLPKDAIGAGLETFTGASRRFEYKGNFRGADIYDDYAHHPSELKALFDAVLSMGYRRVICAFQPHTYSRTKALIDHFSAQLARADLVLLADIYAAREQNNFDISSEDLQANIPNSVYCGHFEKIVEYLRATARDGDLILTVGAGDIFTVGEKLLGYNG